MIIVPVKEGENIEKALKKFKRKFEKTGAIRELRARREFEKPSVKARKAKMKAIYVQHLQLTSSLKSRWNEPGRLQLKRGACL
mgnify:CR=1 FL=1